MNLVLLFIFVFVVTGISSQETTKISNISTSTADTTIPEKHFIGTDNPLAIFILDADSDTQIVQLQKSSGEELKFSLHLKSVEDCTELSKFRISQDGKLFDTKQWSCDNRKPFLGFKGEVTITKDGDWDTLNATIIAQVYFENEGKSDCPKGNFNCKQAICSIWGGGFYPKDAICIPVALRCDGEETCCLLTGEKCSHSWDEQCVENLKTPCSSIFTPAAIIIRSIIAILFVMIPTLIIFVIFYRKQVNLHRAQLMRERLTHRRYSIAVVGANDLRYANDIPPTYEDIYDTKEPPPCFCEAVAVPPSTPSELEAPNEFTCTCNKKVSDAEQT